MSDSAGEKPEESPIAAENGTADSSVGENSSEAPSSTSAPSQATVAKPKYRYDWYQTESDVCINILIKKLKKDNVKVDFQENSVSYTPRGYQ